MHLDAETVGACVVKSVLGATWNLNKIIVKELGSVNCGIIWYLETPESRCETHAGVKLRQALPSVLCVCSFFNKNKLTFWWGQLKINSGQFCKKYKYQMFGLEQVKHLKAKKNISIWKC